MRTYKDVSSRACQSTNIAIAIRKYPFSTTNVAKAQTKSLLGPAFKLCKARISKRVVWELHSSCNDCLPPTIIYSLFNGQGLCDERITCQAHISHMLIFHKASSFDMKNMILGFECFKFFDCFRTNSFLDFQTTSPQNFKIGLIGL